MLVNVTISGDRELIASFKNLPRAINEALYRKIKVLALKLENKVKVGKLNGQVLNRITGALARSIHHDVDRAANTVVGRVFSSGDVKYAGIHEYGGTTAPHIIVPKKASVLAFAGAGGAMVFTRRVNHPGSRMPERSFLRSSLNDMSKEISLGMKEAVVRAVEKEING